MTVDELVEWVAEELLKIPRGYVGITDPVDPMEHERRLKRTRVQAKQILSHPGLALIDRGSPYYDEITRYGAVIPLSEALPSQTKITGG